MSVLDLLNKPNLKKGLEIYAATPVLCCWMLVLLRNISRGILPVA
jgi:hypothetical protein